MPTINFSTGSDVIVPSNNGTTSRGLAGDDIYIISEAVKQNAKITIVDTSGNNKIQLIDGLTIASSKIASNAVQLTLKNGAVITINGASNFIFEISGNATTGKVGEDKTFEEFAIYLGLDSLPTKGTDEGNTNITIGIDTVDNSDTPDNSNNNNKPE